MFFPAWFTAKNRLQEMEKEYRRKQERVLDCKKKKKKRAALASLKTTRQASLHSETAKQLLVHK